MSQHQRSRSTGNSRPAPTHRFSAPHPNSSAFSASANANEDWTKISDLAERRRIQNRIAQRAYRKKLKKRLESLENRASASPEPELHDDASSPAQRSHCEFFGLPPTSTARITPDRFSQSPEPSYPAFSYRPSYLELPSDRHLSHAQQPSLSYTSYGSSDDRPYLDSPSLSSYSVPSPALSAVSYDNNSYLSAGFRSESSVSSPTESTALKTEYFEPNYIGTFDYNYSLVDDQKRHLSAPTTFPSYTNASMSHKHGVDTAFDSFDSSLHDSSATDIWNLCLNQMIGSPPSFQL